MLNLLRLHQQNGGQAEHASSPFFRNPLLNRSIFVKHRVRPHEQELFDDRRANATKLIIPIDTSDLRAGGRFAFIGQRGWEGVLASVMGEGKDAADDYKTLDVLDEIPSFDPFLLREQLKRADLVPAPSYFDISPADTRQMLEYLRKELRPLVKMSMASNDEALGASTAAIAEKLMSHGAGDELALLGKTLRLTPSQYAEGVFCWKGFLYYKWRMERHAANGPALAERIRTVKALGAGDPDDKAYVTGAKARIAASLLSNCRAATDLLKVYDEAFRKLVTAEDPLAFRNFLLEAPGLFVKLGDLLGVVDHIDGFWNFRFPRAKRIDARADELAEIFLEFEDSLGGESAPQDDSLELAI